jgi:hypothetical protein
MTYHHLGIPTTEPRPGEVHLEHLHMYVSGFGENPYGIEWIRFEADAPYPELVKTVPHVAFEVPDLESALVGETIIIPPNRPSLGVVVAFIDVDGAPVELLQIDRSVADEGL